MTITIQPWMIHQNGEPAATQEQQKKEIHKMSHPQPCGKTMWTRRMFQIYWRQERFRGKSEDQILTPGNRHRHQRDKRKSKNEPRVHPDPETVIRRIMDCSVSVIEVLHDNEFQ